MSPPLVVKTALHAVLWLRFLRCDPLIRRELSDALLVGLLGLALEQRDVARLATRFRRRALLSLALRWRASGRSSARDAVDRAGERRRPRRVLCDEAAQVQEYLKTPPTPEEVDPNDVPPEHRQVFLNLCLQLVGADGVVAEAEMETLSLLEKLLRPEGDFE